MVRVFLPSKLSRNPSNKELRCLTLNRQAGHIFVNPFSKYAYYALMSSDDDIFVAAHDL